MAKIFDHAVIYGGKFYPANTPIEETTEKNTVVDKPKKTAKKAVEKYDKSAN